MIYDVRCVSGLGSEYLNWVGLEGIQQQQERIQQQRGLGPQIRGRGAGGGARGVECVPDGQGG